MAGEPQQALERRLASVVRQLDQERTGRLKAEKALRLTRMHLIRRNAELYLGETQEAADWFRRADAIAPRDPDRWTWLQGLGRALIQQGRYLEAMDKLSQAMDNNPGYLRGEAWLAAALAVS